MAQLVRFAAFPQGIDLHDLCAALAREGLVHEVVEGGEYQVLYVGSDVDPARILALIDVDPNIRGQHHGGGRATTNFKQVFRQTPVVFVCLALSILGTLLVEWRFGWVHWYTFQDFYLRSTTEIEFSTLSSGFENREYWRLLTPIFIHFGIFHLAFNGLWLWEFGRRIEKLAGSGHFLSLVLVVGVAANFSQYLWAGPTLFGGMSGVVYGLLGYLWMRHKLAPNPGLAIPRGIFGFLILWLVVGMSGLLGYFFQISIANAAHAGGLLVGAFLGATFGLLGRQGRPPL